MSELKPCAFCGGNNAEVIDEVEEYREKWGDEFDESGLEVGGPSKAVVCRFDKGGCGAIGGWRETEAEAIEAWNRRANDAWERPYYEADLRRAFSDRMERLERRDRMANDGLMIGLYNVDGIRVGAYCETTGRAQLGDRLYAPERTCEVDGSYFEELIGEHYVSLTCGHEVRGMAGDFGYCPECGARVIGGQPR